MPSSGFDGTGSLLSLTKMKAAEAVEVLVVLVVVVLELVVLMPHQRRTNRVTVMWTVDSEADEEATSEVECRGSMFLCWQCSNLLRSHDKAVKRRCQIARV